MIERLTSRAAANRLFAGAAAFLLPGGSARQDESGADPAEPRRRFGIGLASARWHVGRERRRSGSGWLGGSTRSSRDSASAADRILRELAAFDRELIP